MKNIYSKAFSILKNNLIYIQPLLFYLLIIMLILPPILGKNTALYPKVLLIISSFLLTVATTAGWLYINKKAVIDFNPDDNNEEIAKKSLTNLKTFFTGVGEYFFKTLLGYFCFISIYILLFYLTTKFCLHFLGEPTITHKITDIASIKTVEELNNLLKSIPSHDILILKLWIIIYTIAGTLFNFLGYLYFIILFSEKYNVLKSIYITIIFFIKNIIGAFLIILFMFFIYIMFNVITMILGTNSLAFAIFIILATLYLNYYIILVFCFYNEKEQNNSNNWTERNGENTTGD